MGWENDFHVYAMTMGTNNKYQKRQQSAQKTLRISGERRVWGAGESYTLANRILPEKPCQFWFQRCVPKNRIGIGIGIVWNGTALPYIQCHIK